MIILISFTQFPFLIMKKFIAEFNESFKDRHKRIGKEQKEQKLFEDNCMEVFENYAKGLIYCQQTICLTDFFNEIKQLLRVVILNTKHKEENGQYIHSLFNYFNDEYWYTVQLIFPELREQDTDFHQLTQTEQQRLYNKLERINIVFYHHKCPKCHNDQFNKIKKSSFVFS